MISEHWDRLKAILDRYAAASFVADAAYTFQLRPGGQGYLQGTIRYDNARHRPPLASEHHKHTADGVAPSNAPELSDVLAEIALSKGWLT